MQLKNYFPFVGKILSAQLLIFIFTWATFAQTITLDRKPPKYPADARGGNSEPRQPIAADKLAPELQILSQQFEPTRGGDEAGARANGVGGYTARQLQEIFGLTANGAAQTVNLAIETNAPTTNEDLKRAGANVYLRSGNLIVAAGNEGRLSLHASGRFGARKPGQSDTTSPPIEVFVNQPSLLLGTFAARDEWGIFFRSSNPMFQGADGKPTGVYFFKRGGNIEFETDAPVADRESFDKFVQTFRRTTQATTDSVVLQLPEGQYLLFGFGVSEKVFDGKFSFYLPNQEGASFGLGTEKKFMVNSPGNATKVITVGSTDFRSEWENRDGQISQFNLAGGELSDYSSPGPRRDGVTKPEIVAPGRYTIASLSKFSIPENGGCKSSLVANADLQKIFITKSRNHVAWSGTSASTPFVAGVIALMLQKNPHLKAEQIKQILIKTASGRVVNGRAVNDERLGYGKIEPAAALKNVPAPPRAAPKRK